MVQRIERGVVSLEYLVIGIAIIVIVGALAMRSDVADTVSCKFGGLVTSASGGEAPSCGRTTTVADDDSGGVTSPPDAGTVSGQPPSTADPGGEASDTDADTAGTGDEAEANAPSVPFDQGNVDDGIDTFEDKLDGGWNGVRSGELGDIEDMLDDLSGTELDAVIADMSDAELAHWMDELDDGRWGSGWSRERRREMWSMIASKASPETMERLAEFTDEVQPAFDGVGGDDAGDGTSPVDDAEYTEVPHELIVDGVDPHDVVQGSIGDCWLIASMAALANTNPDAITDLITANPNGTYTVTLYDGDDAVHVTVTPDIPTVDGDPLFADNASGGDPYELWPHLLEKAAAQYYGDYTDIEGDWPSKALGLFTGTDIATHDDGFGFWDDMDAPSVDSVRDTLADGGAVLVSTAHDDRNDLYENDTIVQGHAYYVYEVRDDGTVLLANPWGLDSYPPIELTPQEFADSFIRYDVANPGK